MSHHHCLKIVPEEKKYKKCLSKYGMQRLLMAQHGVIDLEPELTSYAHTRALVRQMDLVISIDTSVAPLHIAPTATGAGAMTGWFPLITSDSEVISVYGV